MHRWVGHQFRAELLRRYPGLEKDAAYRRFMFYLLYGSFFDDETGELVVSTNTLGRALEIEHLTKWRNFPVGEFLENFRKDVVKDFQVSNWSYVDGKARTVVNDGLDPEVHELVAIDARSAGVGEELVDFVTGARRTRKTRKSEEEALRAVLEARIPDVAPQTMRIVRYHNGLPRRGFTQTVASHLDQAWEFVHAMPEGQSKNVTEKALRRISLEPKPLLMPVENTVRAFSHQSSLVTIKREVRKILTADWVEYDLKSAQLAIVARLWGIPELLEFLEGNTSPWGYLADAIAPSTSTSQATRDVIKKAMYALVFGASKTRIMEVVRQLEDPPTEKAFFDIDLIHWVYQARERQLDAITKRGYGETLYGKRIPAPTQSGSKRWWSDRPDVANSILAQQAHSVEMELITQIYDVLEARSDATIMLYQFDGVSVRYDKQLKQSWAHVHDQVIDAVNVRAEEMGIPTILEASIPRNLKQ